MFTFILTLILFVFFLFFPVLLWGYAMNMLSDHEWNRERFLYGLIGGGISVMLISFFSGGFIDSFSVRIGLFSLLLILLLCFVMIATLYGSQFVRVFLRKIALLHAGIFFSLFLIVEVIFERIGYLSGSENSLLFALIPLFFAATLEESLKHLSSLGLTAREFRFSRRDLLVFGFFITLGFVCLENALYLVRAFSNGPGALMLTGVTRSFIALLAHLFAASICIVCWWRALSYRVFSWQYIGLFLFGCIGAITAHMIFNTLIQHGWIEALILYIGIAYFAFTQWLVTEE